MTRLLFALFLIASPAATQILFTCSGSHDEATRLIFDKRTAKHTRHLTCVAQNQGAEARTVNEADFIELLIRVGQTPYATEALRIAVRENTRRGPWHTSARIAGYVAKGLTIAGATGGIEFSEDWLTAFALGGQHLPDLGELLRSRPPNGEDFERLAWTEQIGIEPGQSVLFNMFVARGPADGAIRVMKE